MRHVAVMTATGSIGLIAIFAVDVISLFWVSRLGVQSYKAAVGYASQLAFILMSINIGLTIAISATVSRALGAGDRPRGAPAGRLRPVITGLVATALSLVLWSFATTRWRGSCTPRARRRAWRAGCSAIIVPANIPMGLGMALSGVLRAAGDARRAMYMTLAGGIVTAFTDPLLIFGFGLGVYGAAWATVISRLVFLAVGLHGAVARPRSRRPAAARARCAAISRRSWGSACRRSWPISRRRSRRSMSRASGRISARRRSPAARSSIASSRSRSASSSRSPARSGRSSARTSARN